MPGLFSRLKGRDGQRKKKNAAQNLANASPQKPKWDDAYTRKSVEPEEIHELLHFCTTELKARGMYQRSFASDCPGSNPVLVSHGSTKTVN